MNLELIIIYDSFKYKHKIINFNFVVVKDRQILKISLSDNSFKNIDLRYRRASKVGQIGKLVIRDEQTKVNIVEVELSNNITDYYSGNSILKGKTVNTMYFEFLNS